MELELAKRQGKNLIGGGDPQSESELKRLEDELYAVPEHLKASWNVCLFFVEGMLVI